MAEESAGWNWNAFVIERLDPFPDSAFSIHGCAVTGVEKASITQSRLRSTVRSRSSALPSSRSSSSAWFPLTRRETFGYRMRALQGENGQRGLPYNISIQYENGH